MKGDKMKVTREIAETVLSMVDAGLVAGVGVPEPGKMCVEAAVCYAMGLPHGDNPSCVSPVLRSLKITLNDAQWSLPQARAMGLRRLALAQLGSAGVLNELEFVERVALMTVQQVVPRALRVVAALEPHVPAFQALEIAALACAGVCNLTAASDVASDAASDAVSAARAASYADVELAFFAEQVVQILIAMDVPGCQWLDLAPVTV